MWQVLFSANSHHNDGSTGFFCIGFEDFALVLALRTPAKDCRIGLKLLSPMSYL